MKFFLCVCVFFFFKFYFIFKLYITVLVLPNIKMNQLMKFECRVEKIQKNNTREKKNENNANIVKY